MRYLTTIAAFSVFALSSGAMARGSKNVNIVNQGGANWYQRTVANYTSEYKGSAAMGGGSDYDKAMRELEAINLAMAPIQARVESESSALKEYENKIKGGGVGVTGAKIEFTDSSGHSDKARNAAFFKDKDKVEELAIRAAKLKADADKNVNELAQVIKTRDAALIQSLQNMPLDSKDSTIKGEDMKDFAAQTLARLQLSDLKSDWSSFVGKAGNAEAQLQVVKAKLDKSILGAYVNDGVLKSSNFCEAVKSAVAADSCVGFTAKGLKKSDLQVVPETKADHK